MFSNILFADAAVVLLFGDFDRGEAGLPNGFLFSVITVTFTLPVEVTLFDVIVFLLDLYCYLLNNCDLFSCGNVMWDGILVKLRGNIDMTNSTLEDAKIGIHTFAFNGIVKFLK